MPSLNAIRLSWPEPESSTLLTAWRRRGNALGLVVETNAEAIRAALAHATVCRCTGGESHVEALRAAIADAEERVYAAHEPIRKEADHYRALFDRKRVEKPTNPLRSLRERAKLSQAEAAARLGITRGALSQSEQRASVSADMIARARKAYGGGR